MQAEVGQDQSGSDRAAAPAATQPDGLGRAVDEGHRGAGIFIAGYNPQIAVDDEAQIIVAAQVTQAGNDMNELVPTLLLVKENLGRMPEQVLADSGYFSPAGIADPRIKAWTCTCRPTALAEGETGGLARKKR